jgi:protocatechuate 3,4-dioxygenase, beta subunit
MWEGDVGYAGALGALDAARPFFVATTQNGDSGRRMTMQTRTRFSVSWRTSFLAAALVTAHAVEAQWCPAQGPEEVPPTVTKDAIIAPPGEPGERMVVTGVVRALDGRMPMADVIVYAYQTNARGLYARDPGAVGLASLHGRLRGWARTGADGRYTLRTIRPSPYPGNVEAQHIHLEVLAPGGIACEIDAVEFNDDPLMTPARRALRPRFGGVGIVTPTRGADGVWSATRDITMWDPARLDTMRLDTDSTLITWKGTKFGGRGKHEGTVGVAPGSIMLGGAAMIAGTITIPLSSLTVTDIPSWEPVPRNRLRNHLLGPDFFEVSRFPSATLELQRAVRTAPGVLRVQARLTIRDSTRSIQFDARLDHAPEASVAANAYFRINRNLWGLTYRGSQAGNDLVDDDITFRIRLVARRRR